ncbi:hypothetical protein [Emticicia sp. BO119]|uniref:hypothetical protein n=1 Tax=Emticicia sp. BO119 TaxID=2757768 RepID=UPI0015F11C1A|nr:hypothetical protein [Emticicia sp. BO119]MBA4852071.1 hypothetical protein [Emticicia sp. BO119]
MSLKAKIIQALKAKHKNKGFGEKAFDAVATFLDATVTEETEIDTAIEGVEGLLTGFQGDADARINTAIAKAKTEKDKEEKGKGGDDTEKVKTPPNEDVPEWAKGMIELNKTLLSKVEALEKGKTTDTRKTELEAILKDTPESFRNMKLKDFGRMVFKDDTEFDAYKTELQEGLEGMKDMFGGSQSSESKTPKPVMAQKDKSGVSSDTQAYIEAQKAANEGKTPAIGKQIF